MIVETNKNTSTGKYEVDIKTNGVVAELEANKEVSIDVSNYSNPVEITPSSGKDGMKKATVTLSNIPSPSGSVTLYGWVAHEELYVYTYSATPSVGDTVIEADDVQDASKIYVTENSVVSVGENAITVGNMDYTRDSTADITIG